MSSLHTSKSMAKTASLHLLLIPLFATFFIISHSNVYTKTSLMYPFTCSQTSTKTCNAYLYHISKGLSIQEIAAYYSTNTSQIRPTIHGTKQDYLILVPCTCSDVYGTAGYFYNLAYNVQAGDTLLNVTSQIYSGQAWEVEGDGKFNVGNEFPIHLLCGCSSQSSEAIITYTVQEHDTLGNIANQLSSSLDGIERLNDRMIKTENLEFIDVEWVLFVPMGKVGQVNSKKGKRNSMPIMIGVVASVAFLLAVLMAMYLVRRRQSRMVVVEDPKMVDKAQSAKNDSILHNQHQRRGSMQDLPTFDSERPVIFSLEEVEEATGNFDETRKIGEGGYGSVYFGMLGKQEVAIKKMKSSKSKEFFAELKVLCKVHHINVV